MSASKIPVNGHMRVRVYAVLQRAVEEGTQRGWQRAHKHTDTPETTYLLDQIESAVLGEICEYFDFPESDEE